MILGLEIMFDEVAVVESQPGVVDQQVDRLVGEPVFDAATIREPAEVRAKDFAGDGMFELQAGGHFLQGVPRAGDEYEVVAVSGQTLREVQSDAGGGACDQCSGHAALCHRFAGLPLRQRCRLLALTQRSVEAEEDEPEQQPEDHDGHDVDRDPRISAVLDAGDQR